jgi:hypothetical protein
MATKYEEQFPELGKSDTMPRKGKNKTQTQTQEEIKIKQKKRQKLMNKFLDMFREPFNHINDPYFKKYHVSNMFTPLMGQTETYKDGKNFHKQIKYFIWCEEGQNDEKPWLLLCQLYNGKYAYYTAYCDYTGFDCQGGMALYIASTPEILVEMAMTDAERDKYSKFLERKNKSRMERGRTFGDFLQ